MEVMELTDSQSSTGQHQSDLSNTCRSKSPELEDWSEIISHDYVPEVCLMECGCCFGDTELEQMVQCGDGHLFCVDCLKRYADEAIHGQGKSQLICMTADCGAPFPRSQMKRALTEEIIDKFDERVQEESLNMANLADLVRCPGCNYAAEIVDENQQVFACTQCSKRSCRHCHADWTDHEGLLCNQVEKNDETTIRTKYEEKMTEARVRQCPKCKAPMLKDGGCNKVTCRCGGTICYICRKLNIDYNHFCQHVGPHKNGCKKCANCSLWTDAEEDDKRIIEQLREQGRLERVTKGFSDDKNIGAPEEKKQKQAQHIVIDNVLIPPHFGGMPPNFGALPQYQIPNFLNQPAMGNPFHFQPPMPPVRMIPPAIPAQAAQAANVEAERRAARRRQNAARRTRAREERQRLLLAAQEQQRLLLADQERQRDAFDVMNMYAEREKEMADQLIDKHLAGLRAAGHGPVNAKEPTAAFPSMLNVSIPLRNLVQKNNPVIPAHAVDLLSGHPRPAGLSIKEAPDGARLPKFQPEDVFVNAAVKVKKPETNIMRIPDVQPINPVELNDTIDLTMTPTKVVSSKSSESKFVIDLSSYPSTSKDTTDKPSFYSSTSKAVTDKPSSSKPASNTLMQGLLAKAQKSPVQGLPKGESTKLITKTGSRASVASSTTTSPTLDLEFSDDDDELLFHDVMDGAQPNITNKNITMELKLEREELALSREEERCNSEIEADFDRKLSALMEATVSKRAKLTERFNKRRRLIQQRRQKLLKGNQLSL